MPTDRDERTTDKDKRINVDLSLAGHERLEAYADAHHRSKREQVTSDIHLLYDPTALATDKLELILRLTELLTPEDLEAFTQRLTLVESLVRAQSAAKA